MNCLIGYRNSERIWSMKVLQQSLGETQSREVKALPSCKDNTSKDRSSQCENLQNLQGTHVQVKK